MTRKEIINEINCLLSELDNGDDAVSYLTQNDVNWLKENIKALEQEPRKGKWIVKEESAYPCRGHMWCECDNCGYTKNAEYHDLAYGDTPKYIMPQFCERCGNKKSNTVIYPTK